MGILQWFLVVWISTDSAEKMVAFLTRQTLAELTIVPELDGVCRDYSFVRSGMDVVAFI
jgi:hypothetical protein